MNIKTFICGDLEENCYAVRKNGEIIIVDPGEYTDELKEYVMFNKENVKYVLLTHCHFDHIGGLFEVKNICKNAKTVIHISDEFGLRDNNYNLASQFTLKEIVPQNADIKVNDGDTLPFGGGNITVMHTPGHTLGSACYIIDDVIFSGDTLFENSFGRTDFPGGSTKELLKSLLKLSNLNGNYRVYSGHGAVSEMNYERNNNPGILTAIQKKDEL